MRWGFVGRVAYSEAVALQERLRDQVRGGGAESLLLLEHPHVYTLGRSSGRADLLIGAGALAERGIEVHETDRGGQVTYHGPGQLVGYPIVDLRPDRKDVRRYVHDLQTVLVRTLETFGVDAHGRQHPETGVWVGERKIASIGVHLSRWLTTHGFALNVSTQLDYFRDIVVCGLPGIEVCSIQSLTGEAPALERVAAACARHFATVFERRLTPLDGAPGAGR